MRKAMVGEYDIIANFSFGGMPYDRVYEQMKLFADKVMPVMKGKANAAPGRCGGGCRFPSRHR